MKTGKLFITDNGRTLCADHLGSSARHTGRDISGQPILAVDTDVIAEADAMGMSLRCENCGAVPGRIVSRY